MEDIKYLKKYILINLLLSAFLVIDIRLYMFFCIDNFSNMIKFYIPAFHKIVEFYITITPFILVFFILKKYKINIFYILISIVNYLIFLYYIYCLLFIFK